MENIKELDPMEEMKRKIKSHKHRFWRRVIIVAVLVILAVSGVWLYLKYETYSKVKVVESNSMKEMDNSEYIEYAGGILKYNRDGIVYMDNNGKEIWNQACQMENPIVETCKNTVVVGERAGTKAYVFQKDGLKGEINTTNPIQKLSVSEQGIVGAILENESTPKIICYDAKGNVLIEHSTSLTNTGYPLDIAVSHDGNTLLASYLYMKGSVPTTKVIYYNFGEAGEKAKSHEVASAEYENTVIPSVAFLNEKMSVLIGSDALIFYEGLEKPKEVKKVSVKKEIKSVAYDKSGVAVVLKNSGKSKSELQLYNVNGKQLVSTEFEGEYDNIDLTHNQIILFDGNKCAIWNKAGICKYKGEVDTNILALFPITGINKYMMINTDGYQKVRLAK